MNGTAMSSGTVAKPPDAFRPIPFLPTERTRQVLLVASGMWLFACSLSVWRCTWDDSYIVFRYAQNLEKGLGLVFNAGRRVEGYTGILWILLLAGGTRLTADPILVSKVLGLLFTLSTLLGVYFLCRLTATDKIPMYGFALVLTASNTHFIVGSVSGLETPLFTSLLCWSLVAFLNAVRATHPRSQETWCAVASLLFALLVLTRPDGILTYFLLWCYAAWKLRKQPRSLILFTLPLLLIYMPYFLWRWHYYGFFFPNTFYVKRGGTLSLLAKGAIQTGKFLGYQTGGWFLSGLVGLAVFLFPAVETTVLGLAIASRVIFDLWSGGVTPGEFRFLVSVLPLIWVLSERVLVGGLAAFGTEPRSLRLLAGTCALLMVGQIASFIEARARNIEPAEVGMEHAHIAVGKWLGSHGPPTATVAVGDIGAIGFWSHANILDLDGLTDAHIAHLPGAYSEQRDSQYVLRQAPNFIVLRTSSCSPELKDISFGTDQAVYSDPQFTKDYSLEECWEFWPRLNLVLYRKDAQR
jgi:arabinofuranosyltransferase